MAAFDPADPPPIAALSYDGHGSGDRILAQLARDYRAAGVRLAGLVQLPPGDESIACDITVELLPDGRQIGLSEPRGRFATGCRLDSGRLEEVSGAIEAMLADAPQLLVLSKFARREAEGHGLRQVIEKAILAGIPVIVGVPKDHIEAFVTFAGDLAMVTDERDDLDLWWLAVAAGGIPRPADVTG